MTRIRDWLLFLHISGAILYLGSSFVITASLIQAIRRGSVAEFLEMVEATALLPMVGALLLLATGIGMILVVDAWSITSGFVLVGLAVILVSGTTESVYFGRQAAALRSALDRPEAYREISSRLGGLLRVALILDALFLFVVWAMVFKPGA